jgi:hypothetical protein
LTDRFFGIVDRRRNYVSAAGPLAEVYEAAAIAAEREVSVRGLRRFFADGAAEFDCAFARHIGIGEVRGRIADLRKPWAGFEFCN